jgi:histone-lysine N-methyltransferase ASH1L
MVSDDDDAAWNVSDSEERASDFQRQEAAQPTPALDKAVAGPRRRGRRKLVLTPEEAERRAVDRRARNAFLARVRRASKRGIVIQDPTQHPLKKISIQCTAAPENTYIPDLPSSLVTLGMTTADARRARNAFLARVRRAVKRGFPKDLAIKMAAKPLPGDGSRDTPVMQAQRAYLEQLEREAVSEMEADARAASSRDAAQQSAPLPSATPAADGSVDASNQTAMQ